MPVEARLSSTWKKRMFFIIAACEGIGLWFLYDGAFGFPKKNEIYLQHQQFVQEERQREWPAFAKSHGWDVEPPEKLYEHVDLVGQYVLGAVALLAGSCAALWLAVNWRRRVRSDTEAVYSDAGVRVPFTAMREVDKRKWDTKGIAVVLYEGGGGRQRRLVLDDYKFAGAEDILTEVEKHLAAPK